MVRVKCISTRGRFHVSGCMHIQQYGHSKNNTLQIPLDLPMHLQNSKQNYYSVAKLIATC
jgi:hypothetical protein